MPRVTIQGYNQSTLRFGETLIDVRPNDTLVINGFVLDDFNQPITQTCIGCVEIRDVSPSNQFGSVVVGSVGLGSLGFGKYLMTLRVPSNFLDFPQPRKIIAVHLPTGTVSPILLVNGVTSIPSDSEPSPTDISAVVAFLRKLNPTVYTASLGLNPNTLFTGRLPIPPNSIHVYMFNDNGKIPAAIQNFPIIKLIGAPKFL